jgi:hypothetical protein
MLARARPATFRWQDFIGNSNWDAKKAALQGPRADIKTALDYQAMDDPFYRAAAEEHAAAAANELGNGSYEPLENLSYYFMPTLNGSRFEPRLATVTFIEAVTAWLALRASNGHIKVDEKTLDPFVRKQLNEYADHLEAIAKRTRASVTCSWGCRVWEVQDCEPGEIDPNEPPQPCPTHWEAGGFEYCGDSIATRSDNLPDAPYCDPGGGNWTESLPDLATGVVESRYAPQEFERTAKLWRDIASL